jgi:hypothetical protein
MPLVFFTQKKGGKGGENTIYVARLEACTKQKTAKNSTEFTLYSTYTSTSISGIFSVACHRWEAAAAWRVIDGRLLLLLLLLRECVVYWYSI